MIPRIVIPILMAVGFCTLAISHADARDRTPPKPRPTPFHVTIESVSADSITINDPDGVKTYKIDKNTEITFKNDTVTADQLQVGMRVEVTPDSVDPTLAEMIQADDPPPAASAPTAR